MTASKARAIDFVLCAVWLALVVAGGTNGWSIWLIAFFAFAAGERWYSGWKR